MSDSRDYKSVLLGESPQAVIQMIVITVNLLSLHSLLLNLLSHRRVKVLNKLSSFIYKWVIVMENLNLK